MQANKLIYSSHLFNSINSTPSTLFLLQSCMFRPAGSDQLFYLIHRQPIQTWSHEATEQEVVGVTGESRRERGKPISDWVVMVMWGMGLGGSVWGQGVGVKCRSTSDWLRLLFSKTRSFVGLCAPETETLWRWCSTPPTYCTCRGPKQQNKNKDLF